MSDLASASDSDKAMCNRTGLSADSHIRIMFLLNIGFRGLRSQHAVDGQGVVRWLSDRLGQFPQLGISLTPGCRSSSTSEVSRPNRC